MIRNTLTTSTKLAIVLVLTFIATVSRAQSDETVAIFLKSNEIIVGKIVTADSLGYLRLSNSKGIFIIRHEDIGEIITTDGSVKVKGIGQNKSLEAEKPAEPELKRKKGYYNLTSVALLLGKGEQGFVPVPSLTTVNGYQINSNIYTGIGTGFEYYKFAVLPIFAEAKYVFEEGKISSLLSFKLGYSIPISKPDNNQDYYSDQILKHYGGIQINPEAGIRIILTNSKLLFITMGYHFQQLSYRKLSHRYWFDQYQYESTVKTDYNRISMRVGFMF